MWVKCQFSAILGRFKGVFGRFCYVFAIAALLKKSFINTIRLSTLTLFISLSTTPTHLCMGEDMALMTQRT